jgi:hypothetical protein
MFRIRMVHRLGIVPKQPGRPTRPGLAMPAAGYPTSLDPILRHFHTLR